MTALLSVSVLFLLRSLWYHPVCLCVHSWLYSPVKNLFYNSRSTRIHRSIFHNCRLKIWIHFLRSHRISRLHVIIGTTFLLTSLLLLCVSFDILWSLWDYLTICASVCSSLSLLGNGNLLIILIAHRTSLFVWVCIQTTNSVAWVRERTIPTERLPRRFVGEVSANFCRLEGVS
jgi:hypothetical protein